MTVNEARVLIIEIKEAGKPLTNGDRMTIGTVEHNIRYGEAIEKSHAVRLNELYRISQGAYEPLRTRVI